MAKKTLAQQIATLQSPVNKDFDIEDDERGVFDHNDNSGSESESDGDDDKLRSQHYINTGKSKLRDNGIHIRDAKYTGKPSSRKSIFDGSDSGSEDDEEAAADEESESDKSEEGQNGDEGQSSDEPVSESGDEKVEESDSGISLADSEEEQLEESESEEEQTDEEEIISKRDKIKSLMASERKTIINRLSASTQTDALKGYAVITQQKFFDNIIDLRIKAQKAVTNSNLLPLNNEIFEEFKSDNSEDKLKEVESSIHNLLDKILSLRTSIYNKQRITKEPLKFTNKKRTFENYAEETIKYDDILNKNRELVLTKWSHKVQSASGASALNASKFKAIHQSAAQQVESNLIDMERLIKRTKLNRRNVKVIGHIEEEKIIEDQIVVDRSLQEDANVFDDEDFYRLLLNDLVDKKISDSNPMNGLTIQLTKTKLKNNVDTKASKGRKLKYTVQEKIQNWEAPNGTFKWSDEQIDEFFAGLLGQKINFNEHEEEESEVEEGADKEEQELLKNDDLKIFG